MFTTYEKNRISGLRRESQEEIFCLGSNRNAEEVNKANVLVTDNLDLVNETKAAEVIAELLLGRTLVKSSKVDVTACIALTDSEGNLAWNWGRFTPTNLELLAMQRELFDGCVRVERAGNRAIKEREEYT